MGVLDTAYRLQEPPPPLPHRQKSRNTFKEVNPLNMMWEYLTQIARILGNTAHYVGKMYRGANKSLARPGRKQATATEDFDVHISYL